MRILAAAVVVVLALVALLVLALRPDAATEHAAAPHERLPIEARSPAEHGAIALDDVERGELVEVARLGEERRATPEIAPAPARTPGALVGRVLGGRAGTTPLAGAAVEVRRRSQPPIATTTDGAGRFTVALREFGPCFVSASADEHGAVVTAVLPEREREVDLVLPVWRELDVQLADAGGPIRDWTSIGVPPGVARDLAVRVGARGARVATELDPPRRHGPKAPRTEAGGRAGQYRVTAYVRPDDEVHALLGDRVVASAPLPAADEMQLRVDARDVRAVARPAEVRVLLDDGGAPVAGARVAFASHDVEVHTVETDLDGRARWNEAPPLALEARIRGDGIADERASLGSLRPTAVEARVRVGWRLAGRVVAAQRATYVSAWRVDAERNGLHHALSRRTSDDGEFELGGIARGKYALSVGRRPTEGMTIDEFLRHPDVVVVDVEHGDVLDARVPWSERAESFTVSKPGTVKRLR